MNELAKWYIKTISIEGPLINQSKASHILDKESSVVRHWIKRGKIKSIKDPEGKTYVLFRDILKILNSESESENKETNKKGSI
jgi:hypothetical protein